MLVDFYSISLNELDESSKNYAEFTHQIKKVFHFVWKSNQNFFRDLFFELLVVCEVSSFVFMLPCTMCTSLFVITAGLNVP